MHADLPIARRRTTSHAMARLPLPRPRDKRFGVRLALTLTGAFLVIISPLVAAIPGPGGVFVFAAGLALMLRNSGLARKLYARLKAKHPKKGAWVDWAMRRRSALRRARRDREARRLD